MSATGTASATSLNFQGFEDFARNGTSPILFNQIYIAPEPPTTAGKWIPGGWLCAWSAVLPEAPDAALEPEPDRFGLKAIRIVRALPLEVEAGSAQFVIM